MLFGLIKDRVSKSEISRGLWIFCRRYAKGLCDQLDPKLKAKGFIQTDIQDTAFILESTLLHVWIASFTLRAETGIVRGLQDIYANGCGNVGQSDYEKHALYEQAFVDTRARFGEYHEALEKDAKAKRSGGLAMSLGDSALRWLANGGKAHCKLADIDLILDVTTAIYGTFESVAKFRAQYVVRRK
jgi:hypothetical protein